jgi:hypothetical protein
MTIDVALLVLARIGQAEKRIDKGLNNNKDKKVAKRFIICDCKEKDF